MTAEEYLNRHKLHSAISSKFDEVYFDTAIEALAMARKEEREKLKALFFSKVQAYCKAENCDMPSEIARIYTDMEIELSKTK